jgi:DNA-binding MarR family transcriptional regulator
MPKRRPPDVRRDPTPDLEAPTRSAHRTEEPRTEGRRGLNLGPLAALLGFRLRRAQLAVYEDFLRGAPVPQLAPSQFGILVMIDENPDKTQQELCEGIGIDKSTFAISLDRLADRGLLLRVRSEDDRRSNSLRLTARGKATLKAMLAHIERHERRVFARLSAVERKQLMAMLKKIGEPEVSR